MKNRTLALTIQAWEGYVRTKKEERILLQRAAARMKSRNLTASLNKWIEVTEDRTFMRKFVRKMLARYQKVELTKGINSWKAFTILHRCAEERRQAGGEFAKKLAAMNETERLHKEKMAKNILMRMRARSLMNTFETWLENVENLKRQ